MPWFRGGRPVLVTGGRGFLGSHLVHRLASMAPSGAEVIAVDNHTRDCWTAMKVAVPPNVRFVTGDILRPEEWLTELDAPSVVIHCAALAGVSTYFNNPESVLRVNGEGSARLLTALEPLCPELVIGLSTSEVYGAEAAGASEGQPTPMGPVSSSRWAYAASKIFAEHLLFAWAARTGVPAISLRPFNVYGPGQVGEGAVRNFAERAVRGEQLKVTGDGSATRAWLYVRDFVEAVLALAASPDAWGSTYNVGDPDAFVSTMELAQSINRIAGNDAGIVQVPHVGDDVLNRWPRTEALREATGWTPSIPLDQGLRATVEFWRDRVADG